MHFHGNESSSTLVQCSTSRLRQHRLAESSERAKVSDRNSSRQKDFSWQGKQLMSVMPAKAAQANESSLMQHKSAKTAQVCSRSSTSAQCGTSQRKAAKAIQVGKS
jgi:hypothetical protein